MYLSIACPPPIPPGVVGGDLTNQKFMMPHHLGNSGDQIPSNPLYLEASR